MKLIQQLSIVRRVALKCVAAGLALASASTAVHAQNAALPRSTKPLLSASAPPGFVARAQIAGRRPGVGSFTAVSISGSRGLKIGLARDGQFLEPIDAPVVTGMLVGAVYRFRVTGIPDRPGDELYPTLEVIDKTYPQIGREHRFPIPIVLDDDDLRLALGGALVTRVIYLEDADTAAPESTTPQTQMTINVGPNENALQTADVLGRPVAILRIGSRVPTDLSGDLTEFLYGCPPFVPLPAIPSRESLVREGRLPDIVPVERAEKVFSETIPEDFPRLPSGQ